MLNSKLLFAYLLDKDLTKMIKKFEKKVKKRLDLLYSLDYTVYENLLAQEVEGPSWGTS